MLLKNIIYDHSIKYLKYFNIDHGWLEQEYKLA